MVMKKILLLLLPFTVLLSSCSKDLVSIKTTYTKYTAIYGDMDEIRATPLVGTVQEVVNPGKIFSSETLLLIGEEGIGIHVIDNTNPQQPTTVSFINVPGNREFFVHNNVIYAESYYDLMKIDISDWRQPQLLGRVEYVFGDVLLDDNGRALIGFDQEQVTEQLQPDDDVYDIVFNQETAIAYFDYQNQLIPASAVPASFAGTSGNNIGSVNRIAYQAGYVYMVSRSQLLTVRDNSGVFELTARTEGLQMETVFPDGDRLFIGTRTSVDFYDISTPSNPSYEGNFWHPTSCDPVYPQDDLAYVTLRTDIGECPGDANALVVLNIRNLANVFQVQEIQLSSPFGITAIGNRLFVGEGTNGLTIFDKSDPQNLTILKRDEQVEAYDVIAHPTRTDLVLIAGTNGLGQYNISEDGTDLSLISMISF